MITKEIAMNAKHGTVFYHRDAKNRDGTAARGRVNGACQTWKTRPEDFRLPMKHGLKTCFDIVPDNADWWCISEAAAVVEGS